jgi:release factor glutamine methyltransferase
MATMVGASVREALGAAVDALSAIGVEDPRLDAELLLAEAAGWERAALVADPGQEVLPAAARSFGEMVRRRLRREPVAYILGRKGFRNLELAVDRRVLVPRPETELLVEVALEVEPKRALDVGTGSGAIALAVADELPECEVTAADTSPAALEVARANAERLGLSGRVRFLEGTLPEGESFDLVLANLPYVAERDWPSLQPEVTQWEPREALLAGPDGLDAYRSFIQARGRASVTYGGLNSTTLAVEVGDGQAPAVAELMREAGFGETETRRDLAGIERVVVGRQ